MDRLSPDYDSFDWDALPEEDELTLTEADYAPEPPPSPVGQDDRRLQVRAYSYWASLLGSRSLPSTDDLDLNAVADFATNSVLLDFTGDPLQPAIRHIGTALAEECGADARIETVDDVPARSLLSRITGHYMEILANRAPIGFEAEFVNARGEQIMYRGILMPFSRDDEEIDSILGVINWKEALDADRARALEQEVREALSSHSLGPALRAQTPVGRWADGPNTEAANSDEALSGGLHDCLVAARALAAHAESCEDRSRLALYNAIGRAYDVSLAAAQEPDAFAELLTEYRLKVQARAPMTPVVKLVFGSGYDKTRLTEYAAALSFAHRQEMAPGMLARHLRTVDGGLKAVVQEERRLRRLESGAASKAENARPRLPRSLRSNPGRPLTSLPTEGDEFGLVMIRRLATGEIVLLGEVTSDHAMIERAARRITNQG
ncbi:PAS domain-containing protein [Erythrobacter sp. 3-20A1M]|uniref:PAS domain-containing protein n=1 Tax=Erythrobacter sp. 3-20A1M TaxID=2653850 RepID=UPI001BFC7CFC|nr:PAS domain-containing protein [Erythrobacter sp. 3-20A1M]QWC56738.1 PAS domain-containing protein [Erythrobacter sp. 3-20A1M]